MKPDNTTDFMYAELDKLGLDIPTIKRLVDASMIDSTTLLALEIHCVYNKYRGAKRLRSTLCEAFDLSPSGFHFLLNKAEQCLNTLRGL